MYSESLADDVVDADLCIVGAGMAGLTVARELLDSGLRICLVETGGFAWTPEAQSLNLTANDGPQSLELVDSRPRVFGGSSHVWGNLCCPLDDSDFAPRPDLPLRHWPFGLAELERFYSRANEIFGLGPMWFDERLWQMFGEPPPRLDSARLRTRFWQLRSPRLFPLISPFRFATAYRGAFERSRSVRVILNSTAVRIATSDNRDHAVHMDVRSFGAGAARVHARAFLLAGGAIENARLLMVSGFGGEGSMLGRCFMEHPHLAIGTVALDGARRLLEVLAIRRRRNGVALQPAICPTPEFQAEHDIVNASVAVEVEPHPDCATQAFATLANALLHGRSPPAVARNLRRIAADPGPIVANFYRRTIKRAGAIPRVGEIRLYCRSEQEPNPDSRIVLDRERDRVGVNRVRLDWRLSERDRRTVATMARTVADELARLGLGRVEVAPWLGDSAGWPADIRGGPHHSGTTRMADDPRTGVVDRDGRVFGTDNLYVTGSSVFPTGGYANPGLTVVALALRTAQHLRARLAA